MIVDDAACSSTCAHHPTTRLTANVGVNIYHRDPGEVHHDAGPEFHVDPQVAARPVLGEQRLGALLHGLGERDDPAAGAVAQVVGHLAQEHRARVGRAVHRVPEPHDPVAGRELPADVAVDPLWRLPISSIASRARSGAPPCSGPAKVPIAATTADATSVPAEAATRAVNVEALNPWSMVATR